MSNTTQLYKKDCSTGNLEVLYPQTVIEGIINSNTGENLIDYITDVNHLYLHYIGNNKVTRLKVPETMRRKGLFITYVDCPGEPHTEYYISDNTEDEHWQNDANWKPMFNIEEIRNIIREEVKRALAWYKA